MSVELMNDKSFRDSLEKAARTSKLNINTAGMVSVLRPDSTLLIAPIREFDSSPASELPKGVNTAFAYINSPSRKVPAGYYTLRISAAAPKVGVVPGTLEYVDSHGKTAGKSDIQVDIKSMSLPHPPAFPHSVVSVESRQQGTQSDAAAPAIAQFEVVIVCCPNGYCWFEKQ